MKDSTKEKRSSDDASHVGLGSSWRFQMPQGNRKEPPTVTLMLLMLAMRAGMGARVEHVYLGSSLSSSCPAGNAGACRQTLYNKNANNTLIHHRV